MIGSFFSDLLFIFAKKINSSTVKINKNVFNFLKVCVISFLSHCSDGCSTDVPRECEKIEIAQLKYLEALQYLLEKNRGKGAAAARVMGKIFSCITEMKDATNT